MQKQVKNSCYQVLCESHSFILWTNKDVNKNVTPHPAQVGGALVTGSSEAPGYQYAEPSIRFNQRPPRGETYLQW